MVVEENLKIGVSILQRLLVLSLELFDHVSQSILFLLDSHPMLHRVGFEIIDIEAFTLSFERTLTQSHFFISEFHEQELCLFDFHFFQLNVYCLIQVFSLLFPEKIRLRRKDLFDMDGTRFV